jgi:preprotein translocase SecE subunit
MLNLKEVYAYAFTMVMLFLSTIIYVNTNKGSKNLTFLKESFRELKLITWTSKNEVVSSTIVVLAIIIVSTIIISLFDIGIYKFISSNLH